MNTRKMSLEERLNVLGIDSNSSMNGDAVDGDGAAAFGKQAGGGQLPKTDNLLVLLVQGLQSNDSKMLNVREQATQINLSGV